MQEYRFRMLAFRLREIDEEKKRHEEAYLHQAVKATDKRGRPKYKTFEEFYDYQARIDQVLDGTQFQRDHIDPALRERILKRMGRLKEYNDNKG
ncbi:hypothetical protein NNG48_07185 [Enterococcus faecium]|nr:hypothetical protein [Enterococcus faecium]